MSIHSGLFVDKLFNGSVKDGYCFRIELECHNLIELTSFKEWEKACQKVFCPIHQRMEEVFAWKIAKLVPEM